MTTPQPLLAVTEALGISRQELVAMERAALIHHKFDAVSTASLTVELLRHATEEYGDAFTLKFLTGDLVEIEITPSTSSGTISSFLASQTDRYDVVLRLEKGLLLPDAARQQGASKIVYLFTDAFADALERGISSFEQEVWSDATKPLDIHLCDSTTTLVGPWLRVLGPIDAPSPPTPTRQKPEDMSRMRAQKTRFISWEEPWTQSLTPFHLKVTGKTDNPRLLSLLHGQFITLAILYLCDRTRASAEPVDGAVAEFRGAAHVATVPIRQGQSVSASQEEIEGVTGVLQWVYAVDSSTSTEWTSDRLPFVQTRLAQILEGRPDDAKLKGFVGSAQYLLQGLQWEWKAFVEGRISSYLQSRKELETTVGETVVSFRERTTDLVKGLSDAALAAVAVLVGTFLASTFKDPFNADLFRIGMIVYAVYVLVFPGLLSTGAGILRFRSAKGDFDARLSSFKRMLGDETDEIVGQRVAKASRDYWIAVVLVGILYLVGATAALAAADRIPELVRQAETTTAK